MLAKDLKAGTELGPTMIVETVERDGDVIVVRFKDGGLAEYHAKERIGTASRENQ